MHFSSNRQGSANQEARISGTGWSASNNDLDQWIMIDIETLSIIQEIITRGHLYAEEWVTKYSVGKNIHKFIIGNALICFYLIVIYIEKNVCFA